MSQGEASMPAMRGHAAAGRQRWRLVQVLGVTLFVGYLDRMNISMALPLIAQQYGWNVAQTRELGGALMTIFYVGYGLSNLLLSPLGARFGPRASLLLVIVLWSLFTALGAVVSASLAALMVTRALLGLAEGIHFPMMNLLTKRWFPPDERARANSTWMGGLLLAICLAPVLLVPLMHAFGWTGGFLILAAAGPLVSLPLVWWHVHDSPERHPRVSEAERRHIGAGHARERQDTGLPAANLWRTMARLPVLLMLLAGTLYNVVAVGLSLWLPTYFVTAKGLPYSDLIYATSLPYVVGVLGLVLWSVLGDRWNLRAALGALGFIGGAASIWVALTVPGVPASVAAFTSAVFWVSAFSACEFSLVQRLLPPEQVAACSGIYNGLTTMIGGGGGPLIVSAIIGGGLEGNASGVTAAVAVCGLGALVMAVLAARLRY